MCLGSGPAIHIEGDAESFERILDDLMITVHNILRGDTLILGFDGDGHAMLVAPSYHHHLFPF